MIIRHVDRTGKPWTFNVDCTPIQGRMFERLLLYVRNMGNREELNLSYLAELDYNTAFRDGIENAVLSALQQWTGAARIAATPQEQAPVEEPDTVEGRKPYYWENF